MNDRLSAERNPEHEARYFAAVETARKGDLSAARREFEAILGENPNHLECWGQLAYLHELHERPEQALGCYRRILEIDPSFHLALKKIADCQFGRGDFPAARKAYRELRGTPFFEDPEVQRKLALTEPPAWKFLRRIRPLAGLALKRSLDPGFYPAILAEVCAIPRSLPAIREVGWSSYFSFLSQHFLQHPWYLQPIEPCDSCGGRDFLPAFYDRNQKAVRCRACGLEFVERRPKEGLDVLTDHYSQDGTVASFEDLGWQDENLQAEKTRLLGDLFQKAGAPFPQAEGRAFEIGFGQGFFLHALQKLGYAVSGIETSKRLVESARDRLGLDVAVGTVAGMGAPEPHFDLVVAFHVLEHLDEPSLLFRKARSLLKPGGFLFLELPVADLAQMPLGKKRDPSIGYANQYHMHFFTPKTLKPYFEKHGFVLEGEYTLYPETHPTGGFLARRV